MMTQYQSSQSAIIEHIDATAQHFFYPDEATAAANVPHRPKGAHTWVLEHAENAFEVWSDTYAGWLIVLESGQVIGASKTSLIVCEQHGIIVTDRHTIGANRWIWYMCEPERVVIDKGRTIHQTLENAVDASLTDDLMPALYTATDPETLCDAVCQRIHKRYNLTAEQYTLLS